MPPIWIMYPNISQYSIGWRMDYGEGYKYDLGDWKKTLSKNDKRTYDEMFPRPVFFGETYTIMILKKMILINTVMN